MDDAKQKADNFGDNRSIDSSSTSDGTTADAAPSRWQGSAVEIRGGCKSYGRGSGKVVVLDHLDMTVPEGSIYGLLGPSGCGKTTLLGTIVDNLRLDHGSIRIYGHPPGSVEAAVPGHRVGYMPQELALFQEFTIAETLQYFGRIHSLGAQKTRDRTEFLVEFLDLPRSKRKVSQLSGGQQRRVSFAVALLHEPEILILDEPTVGVDPLLRTSIWEHLSRVSQDTNSTIIITTHYIEEARQATRVGLMRQGRLLAEASPACLTRHFAISSLEDVFLKLCLKDGDLEGHLPEKDNAGFSLDDGMQMHSRSRDKDPSLVPVKDAGLVVRKSAGNDKLMLQERAVVEHLVRPWTTTSKSETYFSSGRFKALLGKNVIKLSRNIGFLLLSFLLPPLQTILFCLTVGGTPKDLRLAVTNLDTGFRNPITNVTLLVSDLYLNELSTEIVKQEAFETFEEGYDSVATGHSWGLLYFKENFTKATLHPQTYPRDDGKMEVYMDNTNQQISYTLLIQVYASLQHLVKHLVNSTANVSISIPIVVEKPVYGSANPTFTEFMAPGVILTLTYFMAMALTAISFIIEKKEGLYDRSRVAGVNNIEVMFAHIVTQMGVMLIQIALILVFMFAVFLIPCEGSMLWVILLAVLQGLCGMTFGLLISVSVEDEMTAMQASMGIFYPILLLSGIVWPVQGMPSALKYFSYILPQTYACESIRAILYKGWDITYPEVYVGYLITIFWMCFHVVLAALVLKLKSK